MSDNYRLELARVGMNDKKNIIGYLFVYRNDGLVGLFSTKERGGGFVYMKVGTYAMEHSIKGNSGGKTRSNIKCLRPLEDRFRSLLIHDAYDDNPRYLSGCIAPFIIGQEAQKGSSANAMNQLWEMLGGFNSGTGRKNKTDTDSIDLVILTNVQGDPRTKETWEWHKKKS